MECIDNLIVVLEVVPELFSISAQSIYPACLLPIVTDDREQDLSEQYSVSSSVDYDHNCKSYWGHPMANTGTD